MNVIEWLGMGVVASTKETNTKEIMVYRPGAFPMRDGKTEAGAETQEKTSTDKEGNKVKSSILQSSAEPAHWKAMGDSNRMTPPDVREGSEVSLYQVKGQKKIYWTTWGINGRTLRLETVIHGWSANPEVSENIVDPDTEEDFNIENFYTLMISTHTGKTTYRTAQKNGEKTIFELMIDSMNGKIMIGGKEKNYLVLDDIEHSLLYTNVDKSVFSVNKQIITMYSKDKITMNGENEVNILTKKLNIEAKGWQVKSEKTLFDISSSWQVNCPETTWKGNITQEGNITQTGDFNQTGDITSSGTIFGKTDVKSNVSLNTHKTLGVKGGSDTSGGPI